MVGIPQLFRVVMITALLGLTGMALPAERQIAAGIQSPALLSRELKRSTEYRIPVRFNDNHDNGRHYTPRRFWRCQDECPDGVCDHRTREPVWDYRYVGGQVETERDLVALTITPSTGDAVLEAVSGDEVIRLWPRATKGRKREIIQLPLSIASGSSPLTVYIEGIHPGSAELRLRSASNTESIQAIHFHIDVITLGVFQRDEQRFIYSPGRTILRLDPEKALRSPVYAQQIQWGGDVSGEGPALTVSLDPGETPEMRRAVFQVEAAVGAALRFNRNVRVRQRIFTGTPVAQTTAERRREVESLLRMPPLALKQTELPDRASTPYSQTYFERKFTGSSEPGAPVKLINQQRLQYAPLMGQESGAWGIACCYLRPYGIFITKLAYDSGLKLEDLRAVAHHELRHLEHYSTQYAATGFWHVLCRYLDHEPATHFMEADASSASLHSDASWRYLYKCGNDFTTRYRLAMRELDKLASLSQIGSAVTVLQDIYSGLPLDMDEFRRPGFECYIRPPLEVDERR